MPQSTRREFIKQSTALGAAFWVAGRPAWADSKSPIERLNFACIGVDGKGSSDSNDAGNHGNVVAICDIDERAFGGSTTSSPCTTLRPTRTTWRRWPPCPRACGCSPAG